jgi:hypothetical protein
VWQQLRMSLSILDTRPMPRRILLDPGRHPKADYRDVIMAARVCEPRNRR